MMFAVIRLKGDVNLRTEVKDTMSLLKLNRKHHLVLIPPDSKFVNMVKKIQNYVTWGEISPEVLSELLKKRGRLSGNKRLTEDYLKSKINKDFDNLAKDLIDQKIKLKDISGLKPVFRLKPPTKGFERFGLKRPYSLGGSTGYRGENINDLIKRMI